MYLYNFVGPSMGCGGDIKLSCRGESTISSLDYNHDGLYEGNLNCDWLISADVGSVIQLEFTNTFNIENRADQNDCPWDYIQVNGNKRKTTDTFLTEV